MSDYDKLVESLKSYSTEILSYKIDGAFAYAVTAAADAIEQLVNDYEILAKMYAKANEDLCVRTKERDAAVKDIKRYACCGACKYGDVDEKEEPCLSCKCWDGEEKCNWEWRGVQDEAD